MNQIIIVIVGLRVLLPLRGNIIEPFRFCPTSNQESHFEQKKKKSLQGKD